MPRTVIEFRFALGDSVVVQPSEVKGVVRGLSVNGVEANRQYLVRRTADGQAKEEWEREIDLAAGDDSMIGFVKA